MEAVRWLRVCLLWRVAPLWATIFAAGLATALLVSPARASATACHRVHVPNLGTGDNQLRGVSVLSSHEAWAVGYSTKSPRSSPAGLIEHWNGKAWTIKSIATPRGAELMAVAATSSTNAWAVGSAAGGASVIEHWDGRSWKRQRTGRRGWGQLFAVAATSATNAWAVGVDSSGALIEHWNGRAWKAQAASGPQHSALLGVTATSPRNAWAVGADPSGDHVLIDHWNGRTWTVQANPIVRVPPPHPGDVLGSDAQLSAVAATSSTNAWAVGYADTYGHGSGDQTSEMVIEHWNGRAWKRQASADPGVDTSDTPSHLFGVSAISSRNAWAVGAGPFNGATIQQRKGGVWIDQAAPSGELFSVAAASSSNVWAVGAYLDSTTSIYRTFAVRCH